MKVKKETKIKTSISALVAALLTWAIFPAGMHALPLVWKKDFAQWLCFGRQYDGGVVPVESLDFYQTSLADLKQFTDLPDHLFSSLALAFCLLFAAFFFGLNWLLKKTDKQEAQEVIQSKQAPYDKPFKEVRTNERLQ